DRVGDELRRGVGVLRGDEPVEHVGGLDDVIVDADESQVVVLHCAPPWTGHVTGGSSIAYSRAALSQRILRRVVSSTWPRPASIVSWMFPSRQVVCGKSVSNSTLSTGITSRKCFGAIDSNQYVTNTLWQNRSDGRTAPGLRSRPGRKAPSQL